MIVTERNNSATSNQELFYGPDIEVLRIFQKALNFTYTFIEPFDGNYGAQLPNGSWTGLIRQLMYDEVDVVCTPMNFNHRRALVMDYLTAYIQYKYMLIMVKPNVRGSTWTNFTKEFTVPAWLAIAISLIIFSISFKWIAHISPISSPIPYKDSFLIGLSTFLNQACPLKPEGSANRILYISWVFLVYLAYTYYTSFLISSLTVIKLQLPFDHLHELYEERNNYKLSLLYQSIIDLYFESSSDPLKRSIYKDMVLPYPDVQKNNYDKILALMAEDSHIISVFDEIQITTMENRCNFSILPTTIMYLPGSWAVQKNSPMREIFDYQMKKIIESGTYDKLLQAELFKYKLQKCYEPPWQAINFKNILTAPSVFIILALLSLLVLTCEKIHVYFYNKINKK